MKVPCGGFDLDESVFNVDKNSKQVKLNSPISYDYMPEGYPSKDVETTTLMEEQEVTFFDDGSRMMAVSPVTLEIKLGDKLTVVWDGVSYDVIVKEVKEVAGALAFGNLALLGIGEAADYPFLYSASSHDDFWDCLWFTTDTATSHTIKVMRQQVTITPMSTDFIPPMKNLNVVFKEESGSTTVNCNVTYNELRDWVERDVPVFSVFIYADNSQYNIIKIAPSTDTLLLTYYEDDGSVNTFTYKSDGTIENRPA